MKDFFLELNQFRQQCSDDPGASQFLKSVSRLYIILMQTKVVLDSDTTIQINRMRKQAPGNQDELFHFLWFLNSYARYSYFILNEKKESLNLILDILSKSELMFLNEFKENNAEKRCLAVILVINIVRLNFYNQDYKIAKLQILELKLFIDLNPDCDFNHFPFQVQQFFKKHGALLQSYLVPQNQSYFEDKNSIVYRKIRQKEFTNLLDFFYLNQEIDSSKIAFYDYDLKLEYSWSRLNSISDRIASAFEDLTNKSVYVLVCTRHNILFPGIILACWKKKYIPVMINDQQTVSELLDIQKILNVKDVVVAFDFGFEAQILKKFEIFSKNLILLDLNKLPTSEIEFRPSIDSKQIALGLFTSGSTNLPKLCLFTHSDLLCGAVIENENEKYNSLNLIANLRPHFTSAGLNTFWPSFISGAQNLLSESIRKKPIPRFLNEMIFKNTISHLILSPSYIIALFRYGDDKDWSSPYFLKLYFGGNSLPKLIIQKLLVKNFLPSMRYGMTEAVHIISKINYESEIQELNSANVGHPYIGFELKVDSEILCIKSKGLASFELRAGQLQSLVSDSYYATEDHVLLNTLGEIELKGRQNKSVAIHGFRFHVGHVEAAILENEFVIDCRVLAIKSEFDQFVLVAFIIPFATAEISDIQKFLTQNLNERVSLFKRPEKYIFLKEWPLMPNGKIKFSELQKMI